MRHVIDEFIETDHDGILGQDIRMIFMSIWQHLDNCIYLRRMHIASRIGFSSSGVPALEIERFDDLTTPPTTRGMIARDRNDNILQPTSVCVIHRTLAKSQLNQGV